MVSLAFRRPQVLLRRRQPVQSLGETYGRRCLDRARSPAGVSNARHAEDSQGHACGLDRPLPDYYFACVLDSRPNARISPRLLAWSITIRPVHLDAYSILFRETIEFHRDLWHASMKSTITLEETVTVDLRVPPRAPSNGAR